MLDLHVNNKTVTHIYPVMGLCQCQNHVCGTKSEGVAEPTGLDMAVLE